MIKVSVIIPVYNVEKYLSQCLDSITNQSLKDIEIICINDGSKDKSLDILNQYKEKDSRITIINKDNEGISIARNLGIKMAKGEFISFIDSDDWIDKNYLEELYYNAKKYNCDIATCGFKKVHNFRKSIRKEFKKVEIIKSINDKAEIENIPSHNYVWGKIYNRNKFINSNLSFEPNRYFEDIALLIKILNNLGDMVTVPNVYYYYRKNPNSIVNTQSAKHRKDYLWANQQFRNYIQDKGIFIKNLDKISLKKIKIKFFGILILKIYIKDDSLNCKLFGFIPLIKITGLTPQS